jgi:hypothetical protein
MDSSEARFVDLLTSLRSILLEMNGTSHPMLEDLLNPETRASPKTFNYLVATASGTLQDQWFSTEDANGPSSEELAEINDRYHTLLNEALRIARELGLPSGGAHA